MRRLIAVLLLVVFASMFLTGCQSEEDKQRKKAKEMSEQILERQEKLK